MATSKNSFILFLCDAQTKDEDATSAKGADGFGSQFDGGAGRGWLATGKSVADDDQDSSTVRMVGFPHLTGKRL